MMYKKIESWQTDDTRLFMTEEAAREHVAAVALEKDLYLAVEMADLCDAADVVAFIMKNRELLFNLFENAIRYAHK